MARYLQLAATETSDEGPRPVRPIRVVLADDHSLMRRSLRRLLDREEDVDVVAEADDLTMAMRHVRDWRPDVLVLDLRLPHGSSIAAIKRLRAEIPTTEIVVITMQDSAAFAQQALDAGAIGFALKDFAEVELNQAVRTAARGEQFVSPRVSGAMLQDAFRPHVIEL